eukprot:10083-Heterococcus_DN1.PRE.1
MALVTCIFMIDVLLSRAQATVTAITTAVAIAVAIAAATATATLLRLSVSTLLCVFRVMSFVQLLSTRTGTFKFHNRPPEDVDWVGALRSPSGSNARARVTCYHAEVAHVVLVLLAPVAANTCQRAPQGGSSVTPEDKLKKQEADKQRKRRVNAPARIAKIEAQVEQLELAVASLDEKLYASGSDAGLAMDLTKERAVEQDKIDALYIEWEQLEQLLAEDSDEDALSSD